MEILNKKSSQNIKNRPPKTPLWRKLLSKVSFVLLVPIISFTILFAVLFTITEERQAKDTLTLIIASAFSQKGLDDETEIIEIKNKMDLAGVDKFVPIDGVMVEISRRDIEELSPRDLRLKIFAEIANLLYSQDEQEINRTITNDEIKKGLENAGFLGVISKNGHKETEKLFSYALLLACLVGAVVYSLNKGLDRLKVPAKAVLFGSLPGLLISFLLKMLLSQPSPVSISGDSQAANILSNMINSALPQTIDIFLRTYLWVFITSASVYIGILIYKFWNKLFARRVNISE
ncbi:hypothetical protein HGB13_00910 [bacterium]|nr:hypothetical protein [bacterium]